MTPFDRSKLARIVAHMLSLDQPMSAIEAALYSVAPGSEVQDINRAILEGSEGRSIATLLNTEHELTAMDILREVQGRGATQYQILAHFKIEGPEGPEWRSATATAYGPVEPEDIRAAAEASMASYAAREYESPTMGDSGTVALVPGTLQFGFVVPQFGP